MERFSVREQVVAERTADRAADIERRVDQRRRLVRPVVRNAVTGGHRDRNEVSGPMSRARSLSFWRDAETRKWAAELRPAASFVGYTPRAGIRPAREGHRQGRSIEEADHGEEALRDCARLGTDLKRPFPDSVLRVLQALFAP